MTPYRFDNKKRKFSEIWVERILKFLIVGIFVISIVFFTTFIFQKIIQGPTWLSQTLKNQIETSVLLLTPKSVLVRKIQELENTVTIQSRSQIEFQTLRYDYQMLARAVGYTADNMNQQGVVARVVAKPNRSLFNTLVINRGIDDGIALGDLVITDQVIVLGNISSVTRSTATVTLFSGPQFSDNVFLQNQQGIMVPAKGKGSSNFEIHIPREIAVQEGDLLVLPENPLLVLGVVKSIKFDPRDPFQTILARVPVNVQSIGFVEVVK